MRDDGLVPSDVASRSIVVAFGKGLRITQRKMAKSATQ